MVKPELYQKHMNRACRIIDLKSFLGDCPSSAVQVCTRKGKAWSIFPLKLSKVICI